MEILVYTPATSKRIAKNLGGPVFFWNCSICEEFLFFVGHCVCACVRSTEVAHPQSFSPYVYTIQEQVISFKFTKHQTNVTPNALNIYIHP